MQFRSSSSAHRCKTRQHPCAVLQHRRPEEKRLVRCRGGVLFARTRPAPDSRRSRRASSIIHRCVAPPQRHHMHDSTRRPQQLPRRQLGICCMACDDARDVLGKRARRCSCSNRPAGAGVRGILPSCNQFVVICISDAIGTSTLDPTSTSK